MTKLSIVIPTLNESANIGLLIQKIREVLSGFREGYEIILVDGGSADGTVKIAAEMNVRVLIQSEPGFGRAIREGLEASKGDFIAVLDADFSHPPELILAMLKYLDEADLIIASRYITGGSCRAGLARTIISRLLCHLFRYGLAIPVRDITSGFKVFRREVISKLEIKSREFEVQPEMVIHAFAEGWRIKEVPFCCQPRSVGNSHVNKKLLRLITGYLRVFCEFYKKRNSPFFAEN